MKENMTAKTEQVMYMQENDVASYRANATIEGADKMFKQLSSSAFGSCSSSASTCRIKDLWVHRAARNRHLALVDGG